MPDRAGRGSARIPRHRRAPANFHSKNRPLTRLVIVLPLVPLRTGDSFAVSDWPLHVTVLPPFATAAPASEIAEAMSAVAQAVPAIAGTAGPDAMFGRRHNVPVTLVEENEQLNAMHRALVAAVRPFAAAPDERAFTGSGFRPHITIKNSSRAHDGDRLVLTQIALVDMAPRAASSGRTVLATAALRPTP